MDGGQGLLTAPATSPLSQSKVPSMTPFDPLRAAANQHFQSGDRQRGSTFEAVVSAARSTREKTHRLRQQRMAREDAAAAIRLPDRSGATGK